MAMNKQVKVGGSYYEGNSITVSSTPGDYVLDMAFTAAGAASAISVIPNSHGALDTIAVAHLSADTLTTKHVLATGVPNVGKNAAWKFDYPALQKIGNNEKLRVTYTNTASIAMTVYVVLEQIH